MCRISLFVAICIAGLIHVLVLLVLWQHPSCCGLLSTKQEESTLPSAPPPLSIRLHSSPLDKQVLTKKLIPPNENYSLSEEHVFRENYIRKDNSQRKKERTTKLANPLENELGVIKKHFYDKGELNRFPVLSQPIHFNTDGLDIDEFKIGYSDLWLYISESGQVLDIQSEFNSLTPATVQKIFASLKQAHFMPGYISGNPVPSKIRWRVVVENKKGFLISTDPAALIN